MSVIQLQYLLPACLARLLLLSLMAVHGVLFISSGWQFSQRWLRFVLSWWWRRNGPKWVYKIDMYHLSCRTELMWSWKVWEIEVPGQFWTKIHFGQCRRRFWNCMIIIIIILTDLVGEGGGITGRLTHTTFSSSTGEPFSFLLRNANRQTNNLQFSGKQSREKRRYFHRNICWSCV